MNSSTKAPSVMVSLLSDERIEELARLTDEQVRRRPGLDGEWHFARNVEMEVRALYDDALASTEQASAVSPPALAKLRAVVQSIELWQFPLQRRDVLALIDKHGGALEQQQGHQSEPAKYSIARSIEVLRMALFKTDTPTAYMHAVIDEFRLGFGREGHQSERSETAVQRPVDDRRQHSMGDSNAQASEVFGDVLASQGPGGLRGGAPGALQAMRQGSPLTSDPQEGYESESPAGAVKRPVIPLSGALDL